MHLYTVYHTYLSELMYHIYRVTSYVFFQKNWNMYIDDSNNRINKLWSDNVTVTYSCRQAFHLLLKELAPLDKEVIMSDLTIRNMAQLVEYHGAKIVPFKVSYDSGYPDIEHLHELLNEKTRMIVISHLFGVRINDKYFKALRQIVTDFEEKTKCEKIYIVEDVAQSYNGLNRKSPYSDIALFSFGTSKHYTAIKGGLFVTSNDISIDKYLSAMPIASTCKCLKDCMITLIGYIISLPAILSIFIKILDIFSIDHEDFITKYFTAYRKASDVSEAIGKNSFRLHPATMDWIYVRMTSSKCKIIENKNKIGRLLTERLNNINIKVVSGKVTGARNYWIYNILVDDPDKMKKYLKYKGYACSKTATTFGKLSQFTDQLSETDNDYKTLFIPVTQFMNEHDVCMLAHHISNFKGIIF